MAETERQRSREWDDRLVTTVDALEAGRASLKNCRRAVAQITHTLEQRGNGLRRRELKAAALALAKSNSIALDSVAEHLDALAALVDEADMEIGRLRGRLRDFDCDFDD